MGNPPAGERICVQIPEVCGAPRPKARQCPIPVHLPERPIHADD